MPTLQASCTRDIACGGEDLRRAALGVAGAVVNNKELRKRMTGEEIRNLIGAACACSEDEGRDMHTRAKCMWMLAMQTFSGAQVEKTCAHWPRHAVGCISCPMLNPRLHQRELTHTKQRGKRTKTQIYIYTHKYIYTHAQTQTQTQTQTHTHTHTQTHTPKTASV
jgi:hypothetical protein